MRAGLVVLLQGLLLAARCDGRARNPQLPEDLRDMQDHGGMDGGYGSSHEPSGTASDGTDPYQQGTDLSGTVHYPPVHGHTGHGHPSLDPPEDSAEPGPHGTTARTGNWCAFVHKQIVTTAVACGTERYTIKSQSRCPNGTPDCQLVMYKTSTRPVYREQQQIFTALLWRCCPGHGGKNCDETVADGHASEHEDSSTTGRLHPGGPGHKHTGPERLIHKENLEQSNHDDPSRYLSSRENQTEEHSYDYPHVPLDAREKQYDRVGPDAVDDDSTGPPPEVQYPNPELLPIQYLKDIMMSHLQPVLDSFNLTLERLSQEVKGLQRGMADLQLSQELEMDSQVERAVEGEKLQQHEDKLTNTFQQLEELRMQLNLQRDKMEERFHEQQAILAFNLTGFKMDMDVKMKRHHMMLQTNLQILNSSLSEVKQKQEQEQLGEELQEVWTPARTVPTEEQPQENTAVWEAISRLDNKVVNNTVRLSALNEDQVKMSQNVDRLQKISKSLDERITQTDRKNEDRYIEAFLEVDGVKLAVQNSVHDKINNITNILQEMEVDVDYLYTQFYQNLSSGAKDCDCKALTTSMSQLKQDVAAVQVIATENRLALDRAAEERVDSWGDSDWRPSVDDLKLGLENVRNSLAFEQEKSRTLQQNLTMLQVSLAGSQNNRDLTEQHRTMAVDVRRLHGLFNTLLKDATRHAEVLAILLGEEVLEFMDLSVQVQGTYSIPALKQSISDMQDEIDRHSQSLASMLNSPRDTAADEPSSPADWTSVALKSRRGHQTFDYLSEKLPDYTDADFFALEKMVEHLRAQVLKLEEQRRNCTRDGDKEAKLQVQLTEMRNSLEDHLRIFNSVFTNIEGLVGSEATVDLDKLSAQMKRINIKQERKRQKKREDAKEQQHGEHKLRSKRDASLETAVLSQLPESPLMFLASRRDGVNESGTVVFDTLSLNRGQMYSPKTGTFRAPTAGVYLFVLTLDFGPGPSLARLKRGEEAVASLHQSQRKPAGPATRVCLLQLEQDEELQLEIVQGTLEPSSPQDNTFAGLLILQTT